MVTSVENLMNIIANGKEELTLAKYNIGILGFLCHQMEKVEFAHKYLQDLEMKEAEKRWDFLKAALRQGVDLIRRHHHFDLSDFIQIKETQSLVKQICQDLKLCVVGLQLGNVISIDTSIDEASIEDDRTRLRWHAISVMERGDGGSKLDPETATQLNNLKKEHLSHLEHLHFIQEQDIEWGSIIGKGSYGEVREGWWREHRVAVKKFNHHPGYLGVEARAEFYAEVEIQIGMRHSNIVAIHAASIADQSAFIVMEMGKTSLRRLYQQEKLTLIQKITLLANAADGLRYLHSRGMIHQDMKSDNTLLFGDFPTSFVVKVSGYGLASLKAKTKMITTQPLEALWWVAPEIYRGRPNSVKADVFSFGVIMHEVVAQKLPYGQNVPRHTVMALKRKAVRPCSIPEDCPEILVELMRRCISPDPAKRPDMSEVSKSLKELFDQFENQPMPPAIEMWMEETIKSLDRQNSEGMTLFQIAAQQGNLEVGAMLLSLGKDINSTDLNGWTPLHWAAYNGHIEMSRFLLENDAMKEPKNRGHHTPLHLAASAGRQDVVHLLLEMGVERDAKTQFEETALHWAAYNGHKEVVRQLMDMGADGNAKENCGNTPLHHAAEKGHLAVAEVLMDRHVEQAPKNKYNRTPLHVAATLGNLGIVRLLLENGANINPKCMGGDTPLHSAARHGHHEVVVFLLEHGADTHAKNNSGQRAKDVARKDVKQLFLLHFKDRVLRAMRRLLP